MELREMQSLLLLERTGSILHTSAALGLTPGAVHKHLKTLERELGAQLYVKSAAGLSLTPEGRIVLPYFQQALAGKEAAAEALLDFRHGVRGIVRVGAGPSFSSSMLPAVLRKFRARRRQVEVYVETGNGGHLLDGLRGGSLDLIFDPLDSAAQDIEIAAAWDAPIGIVSALAETAAPLNPAKLRGLPFILFQKDSRMDKLTGDYFAEIGLQPKVVMRSDSAEAIKAMVKNRLGVAPLFLWNVNPELRSKTLHVVHAKLPPLAARMGLMRRKSAYVSQALAAFIETAREMDWRNLRPVEAPTRARATG
jgi:DNA-binding transcriptional LysR family regulator